MTPRQADIAFVLEGVQGVRALYAINGGRAAGYVDFAVEMDRDGRVLAEAHYALLRVMTHDECARVFLFFTAPHVILQAETRVLALTASERDEARRRVPPPVARLPMVLETRAEMSVLIVDEDIFVEAVVRGAAIEDGAVECVVAAGVDAALKLTTSGKRFDLILCVARYAFGRDGLLARLPIAMASRVIVLVTPTEIVDARWRLQGSGRILTKPLEGWILRERMDRIRASINLLWIPDLRRAIDETQASTVNTVKRRELVAPPASAPFSALMVDAEDEVHEALRRVFFGESRHVMLPDADGAVEEALSKPFHLIVCSLKALNQNLLDGIAREDSFGADSVVVVAPERDVPYVRHRLSQMGRRNTVLSLPIDDASLRDVVLRAHPTLANRVAIADVADADEPNIGRLRFRRLAALVVDDDSTTEILFSAGAHEQADVVLATTPMQAFEHLMSRPIDVLIVSATMRGDGGEPFYRVLWRLKPELKSRSILIMASAAIPASAPRSHPPRILERPVTRNAIDQFIEAMKRRGSRE